MVSWKVSENQKNVELPEVMGAPLAIQLGFSIDHPAGYPHNFTRPSHSPWLAACKAEPRNVLKKMVDMNDSSINVI